MKVGSVPEYPIKTNGSAKKETPLAERRPNDTIVGVVKENLLKYVIPSKKSSIIKKRPFRGVGPTILLVEVV